MSTTKHSYILFVFIILTLIRCADNKEENNSILSKNDINEMYENSLDSLELNPIFSIKVLEKLRTYNITDSLQGRILMKLGSWYSNNGSLIKSLETLQEAQILYERLKNYEALSVIELKLGQLQYFQGYLKKSLNHYRNSIKFAKKAKNIKKEASGYFALGTAYWSIKDKADSSLINLKISLKLRESINDTLGLANTYTELGEAYQYSGNKKESKKAFKKGYSTYKMINNIHGVAISGTKLANQYLYSNIDSSKYYIDEALTLIDSTNDLRWKTIVNLIASSTYQKLKNFEIAYKLHKKYKKYEDEYSTKTDNREFLTKDLNFAFDKEKAITEQKHKDKLEQEAMQRKSLYTGLILVIVFAFFMFRRFRFERKQKHVIDIQRKIVEEKNKEILDSIKYAKRIQTAILPPQKIVRQYLEDSFILYKPKDIVAGDFYWLETIDNLTFFAAADCTGHGVPGAMVSVMCSNALTKAVKELNIYQPSLILDKTVELLEERFSRSESEIYDGMDVALCCLNHETSTLSYAGANNSLYIIKDGLLNEIKADKQPIGRYFYRKEYTNHSIDISDGDCFYIFSDGYPDQFGGPKNKKFKYKPFKRLLEEIHSKPMMEQRDILDKTIEEWKGNLEQIDDICVIGLRI